MLKGLWPLRGTNPPLYTAKAADVIIDKETKKEYIRDKIKLFTVKGRDELPKTIEQSEPKRWEFVRFKQKQDKEIDYLKEIYVNTLFK